MSAAADGSEDPVAESAPQGPGERLKAARQAAGMEIERVADRLHLKPADVEALERDAYEGFAARVFVRGYLRNYARLVGLPADSVLAAFDAVYPDPDRPLQLKPVGTHKPQVSSRHGAVRLVSWLLVLGVVALFLVWWAGYLQLGGDGGGETAAPPAAEQAPEEQPPPLLTPEGGLALPEAPAPESSPEPADEPQTPQADAAVVAPQQAEPPVAAESAAPAPPVSAEPAPTAAPAPPVSAEPAPTAEPAVGRAALVPPQVVLTLTGPCWVEIRDRNNGFRLIGALQAGERRVLEGQPPYRILLGNAPAARLTVDGQPVDLGPHTQGRVARLTLDPAAR
jgi:cytoskeleton protein RodZ